MHPIRRGAEVPQRVQETLPSCSLLKGSDAELKIASPLLRRLPGCPSCLKGGSRGLGILGRSVPPEQGVWAGPGVRAAQEVAVGHTSCSSVPSRIHGDEGHPVQLLLVT